MKHRKYLAWLILAVLLTSAACLTACGECRHSYTSWSVLREATCTSDGTQSRSCEKCGYTETQAIGSLGHSQAPLPTQAATCSAPGLTGGVGCSSCGLVLTEPTEIPALAHTEVVTPGVEATCTESGLSESSSCSVCGEVTRAAAELPPLDHNYVTLPGVAATCTQSGLEEYQYCSRCTLEPPTQKVIPALGHSYKSTVLTAATCSQNGTQQNTCSLCNDSFTSAIAAKEHTASEVYSLVQQSLAEISVYDKNGGFLGLGTGFVYSSDGKIVTNYHVIDGAWSAEISIGNKNYSVTQVLAYDKNRDLAILKINTEKLQAAKLCMQEHPVGKTVFAAGSSRGLTGTFSQGIITYANRMLEGVSYVQHDAAISGGNSGGPLLNSYGEVIGINSWTLEDSQNLNFAVSVRELSNLKETAPKTLSQVAQDEWDAYTVLKNALLQYGTWNEEDQDYGLYLGETAMDGDTLMRYVFYAPALDCIDFYLFWDDVNYTKYTACLSIDGADGAWSWFYYDYYDEKMYGALDPATLYKSELLNYTDHNITSNTLRDTVQKFATILIRIICEHMTDDLANLGITAADMGFYGF